jgi:hypothetical protein
MAKKFVIGLLFPLAFLFFTACSYGQTLNERERGIYLDIVERWHEMLYTKSGNSRPSEEEIQAIWRDVANKYNISFDEVKNIDNKALTEANPTDEDYKIYDDLWAALDSMPQGATTDDTRRIHSEIANKYGISLYKLHEIEYEMDEGMWGWI